MIGIEVRKVTKHAGVITLRTEAYRKDEAVEKIRELEEILEMISNNKTKIEGDVELHVKKAKYK